MCCCAYSKTQKNNKMNLYIKVSVTENGKAQTNKIICFCMLNGETVYHFMCISLLPSKDQLHLYSSTFLPPETTSNRNFTYLFSFCSGSRYLLSYVIFPILFYSIIFVNFSNMRITLSENMTYRCISS